MDPKILLIDIETAPDVVWTWGMWQANAIAVKEHWYILSFAAKWLGAKEVICRGLCDYWPYDGGDANERDLLVDIHKLLDEADIVIAHNGRGFDFKKITAKFIEHEFTPPSPYKTVDTKSDLVAKAMFSSHKLDWLSKQLELGFKTPGMEFSVWQGCMSGVKKDWNLMLKYNAHDVRLLEKLYERISPWIDQPNAAIYRAGNSLLCVKPGCKGTLIKRGLGYANTRVYQRYACNKCGAPARSVNSEKSLGAKVRGM